MYLHRNSSSNNILLISPQQNQGLSWAGAVDLLPQLPRARHFLLCFFQHHRNKALSSRGCHRWTIASDGVEMFPRALHPLHSRLISVLLPESLDKPLLSFSCHRYWTLKEISYTWVTPFHFRWVWACVSVSFTTLTSVPFLGHFFLQFPWFPSYYRPIEYFPQI